MSTSVAEGRGARQGGITEEDQAIASRGEDKGTVHRHKGCWEVLPRCRQGCCLGGTTKKQVKEVPVACDLTGKRAPQMRTSCWENKAWQCLVVQMPTVSLQCHSQIYRWLYSLDLET